MSRYIFGPVPSRRLGHSLGINNIPPKVCTYSCVYCQLGRTKKKRTHRQKWYKPSEILKLVKNLDYTHALDDTETKIDYITLMFPINQYTVGSIVRIERSSLSRVVNGQIK